MEPFFSYAPTAIGKISDYSKRVLLDVMRAAGVEFLIITSTQRDPQRQAKAMYNNCETHGVTSQMDLYRGPGQQVIKVYDLCKALKRTPEQTITAMVKKIIEVGPQNVSHHAADPLTLNVFDVGPITMKPDGRQQKFADAARAEHRISKFLDPSNSDPAFHCEIPQPQPKSRPDVPATA